VAGRFIWIESNRATRERKGGESHVIRFGEIKGAIATSLSSGLRVLTATPTVRDTGSDSLAVSGLPFLGGGPIVGLGFRIGLLKVTEPGAFFLGFSYGRYSVDDPPILPRLS
jgi:hypothetical protein